MILCEISITESLTDSTFKTPLKSCFKFLFDIFSLKYADSQSDGSITVHSIGSVIKSRLAPVPPPISKTLNFSGAADYFSKLFSGYF